MGKSSTNLKVLFNTALASIAVSIKSELLLDFALRNKANPNAFFGFERFKGKRGERLLHRTVSKNWMEGVELIVAAGADTEIRGGKKEATPFFISIFNKSPTADILAAHGADPCGKGYGYRVNEEAKVLDDIGWGYPSQVALLVYKEISLEDIVSTEHHIFLIKKAKIMNQQKQLDKSTKSVHSQRKAMRL